MKGANLDVWLPVENCRVPKVARDAYMEERSFSSVCCSGMVPAGAGKRKIILESKGFD